MSDVKNLLITGGSSGIGQAIAKAFIDQGFQVYVFGQHQPDYACQFFQVDISKEDQIREAMDQMPLLDLVVCNAGIAKLDKLESAKTEDLNAMLDTNIKGVFWTCKYAIPKLNSGSSIINVSSIAGIQSYEDYGIYCASKAAVISMSKTFAIELRHRKIRVNVIAPGVIDTDIWKKMYGDAKEEVLEEISDLTLVKRIGRPEEVAKAAIFLAENEFINGTVLTIDGGELAL